MRSVSKTQELVWCSAVLSVKEVNCATRTKNKLMKNETLELCHVLCDLQSIIFGFNVFRTVWLTFVTREGKIRC